jgi:hypothetical protein
MNQVLKSGIRMSSIDHGTIRVLVVSGLSSQFAPKEFIDFGGIAMKSESDIGNVGNDCFNAIATSFNLSIDDWHFVTVFGIVHRCRAGDIDNGTWAMHHFVLGVLGIIDSRKEWFEI